MPTGKKDIVHSDLQNTHILEIHDIKEKRETCFFARSSNEIHPLVKHKYTQANLHYPSIRFFESSSTQNPSLLKNLKILLRNQLDDFGNRCSKRVPKHRRSIKLFLQRS